MPPQPPFGARAHALGLDCRRPGAEGLHELPPAQLRNQDKLAPSRRSDHQRRPHGFASQRMKKARTSRNEWRGPKALADR